MLVLGASAQLQIPRHLMYSVRGKLIKFFIVLVIWYINEI
jgi:hypothetical protein